MDDSVTTGKRARKSTDRYGFGEGAAAKEAAAKEAAAKAEREPKPKKKKKRAAAAATTSTADSVTTGKRKRKPTDRFGFGEGAAANEGAAEKVERAPKKKKRAAAAAATSTADVNYKISDGGDEGVLFVTHVKKGDDIDEIASAAAFKDFNANAEGEVDQSYKLDRPYNDNSSLADLQRIFGRPTEDSYTPSPETLDFLGACAEKDNLNCEQRTKYGFAALSKQKQLRIGFFGGAYQFIVYGEMTPGSGEWVIIHFATALKGTKKMKPYPNPGSLNEFVGGNVKFTSKFELGETRHLREDVNGYPLFKATRFDFRTHDRDEIKKAVEDNAAILAACIARKEVKNRAYKERISSKGRNGGGGGFYEVKKEGDSNYGVRPAKSLNEIKKNIGKKFKGTQIDLATEHLPTGLEDTKSIQTCRGTFIVKRVTFEKFTSVKKAFRDSSE